jgi:uncharacterized protein (TIGR02246 family)
VDEVATRQPLASRPGIRLIDWNADRTVQGRPGEEIATLFSLVVGAPDDEHAARIVHARMGPGGPPRLWHAHPGATATIVLEGSMTVEDVELTSGQMVSVDAGVAYGPIQPGPDGATFVEVFSGVAATETLWDEADPRVDEYRARGWIMDAPPTGDGLEGGSPQDTTMAYFERFGAGDPEGVAALFGADAVFLANGCATVHGRSAISAFFASVVATARVRFDVVAVEHVSEWADTAVVETRTIESIEVLRGGSTTEAELRELFVLRRRSGRWEIQSYAGNELARGEEGAR